MPNPVVVVTGSSTGIGLHISLSLSRRAYTVVATLRAPSRAPAELRASACDVRALDVTEPASASALADYLRETYGGCDVLVNNAGWGLPGTLETWAIDEAKALFDVNVWGAVRMCKVLAPFMRARGGGVVATVSSTSALRGMPCSDAYAGSKQAVEGIMDSYRYAAQADNIKVIIINPGPTVTPFSKRFVEEWKPSEKAAADVSSLHVNMTNHFVNVVRDRNMSGQDVADCGEAVADIIDREYAKKIDDGSARPTFWNPTSDYGRHILNNTKAVVDGNTGPAYEENFTEALKLGLRLKKEAQNAES